MDVIAFDAALQRGDTASLESAVALYRGPLLEGCEEEWIFADRGLREQGYLQALEALEESTVEDAPAIPPAFVRIPHPLTPLIGRTDVVHQTLQELAAGRLVTLTGAGGVGKTRVAIQAARAWGQTASVCFVELASLTRGADIGLTVTAALGIPEEAEMSPEETLGQYFSSQPFLLVLDNCEHLLDACAEFVTLLLHTCPHLRILTTGRQLLGVLGEITCVVPPLEMPAPAMHRAGEGERTLEDPETEDLPAIWMEYEAICLFVRRAQSVAPSFALTAQNGTSVLEICRHLEGIPLALELAEAKAFPERRAAKYAHFVLLTGYSLRLRENIGIPLSAGEKAEYEAHLAAAATLLGEATVQSNREEGRALSLEQVVARAAAGSAPDRNPELSGLGLQEAVQE